MIWITRFRLQEKSMIIELSIVNRLGALIKLFILLMLSMPLLISCHETNETKSTPREDVTDTNAIHATNTIINFYKWYRNNQDIQNCLVNNSCGETYDSTKFYSVNFDATEKYLSALKNTGYISDKYISDWRNYFKECDENFRKNPSNDGVPDGFDYVFVTNSQDFEEELNTVEKAKISSVVNHNDKKIIILEFITGSQLTFELSFIDNKWYIDKIK